MARGVTELAAVTVVVVNYRTLELTRRCVETLHDHYSDLPLVLIDNGSDDESTEYVRELGQTQQNVRAQLNEGNRYHGPALDQGVRLAEARYVLTLDSDCEVVRGGFLEEMLREFQRPETYAVGELRYKNRFGYTYGYGYDEGAAQPERRGRIPYIHPYAMLLDRDKYLRLRPFIHHGAPCIRNMQDARRKGYTVVDFPVGDYVFHRMQGTSVAYGYGALGGVRRRLEYYLNRLDVLVTRDPTLPVRPPRHDDD